MPEKIYALWARANSGKTSTLNQFIKLLNDKYENILLKKGIDTVDSLAVFNIDGKIVGITTQGDKISQLKKWLDKLENHNCDIIFCATRSKGGTRNLVKERYGDKLVWINQAGIYNNKVKAFDNNPFIEARNLKMAELLYILIDQSPDQ